MFTFSCLSINIIHYVTHVGHKAFLGYFYLDYAYNNAVVHVFIKILKESLGDNVMTPSSTDSGQGMEEEQDTFATNRFPPTRELHVKDNSSLRTK